MKTAHPVRLLCALLSVSASGDYDWQRRRATPDPRARGDRVLAGEIQAIHPRSRQTHGDDNAVMESVWSTLKLELLYRREFATRRQASTQIFDYIETFDNRQRTHSALDYRSPVDFEGFNN